MVVTMRKLMLLSVCLSGAAYGQDAESLADQWLTGYAAYRDGGDLTDAANDRRVHVQGAASFAVSFDRTLDENRQLQIFAGYQDSELRLRDTLASASRVLPLNIAYLHLGGTNYFDGVLGNGTYVVGGIGLTWFDPGLAGFDSELRPSANLGLGYQLPLTHKLALRFELRGYYTLLNSSGSLFCSGGCTAVLRGDTLLQGEALVGLSFGW
jgi:hypothetical protein